MGVSFSPGELDGGGKVHLVRSLSNPFCNARAEPKDLHRHTDLLFVVAEFRKPLKVHGDLQLSWTVRLR